MKTFVFMTLAACSLSVVVGCAHQTPAKQVFALPSMEEMDAASIAEAEKRKDTIIADERTKLVGRMEPDRIQLYLDYFERGLLSRTGLIMIEGSENRWLEEAYASGYQRRIILIGFRAPDHRKNEN